MFQLNKIFQNKHTILKDLNKRSYNMKKIIPIISLISAGLMLTGCNFSISSVETDNLKTNVETFEKNMDEYTANNNNLNKLALNKYKLSFSVPENLKLNLPKNDEKSDEKNATETSVTDNNINSSNLTQNSNKDSKNTINNTNSNNINTTQNTNLDNSLNENREIIKNNLNTTKNRLSNNVETKNIVDGTEKTNNLVESDDTLNNSNAEITPDTTENDNNNNDEQLESISTLYSLSTDIDDSCEEFCELKEDLIDAITETQNLITKVQNKEIELTNEQRMLVREQSNQLKDLSRNLSRITNELSINLSDISQMMRDSNGDIDALSLKYLVVLENLLNGNDMLENGLYSLRLINKMFNIDDNMTPNNYGRVLYGFKRNNEPAIIKDYMIDENGNITENNIANNAQNSSESETNNSAQSDNQNSTNQANNTTTSNIDTFSDRKLKTNIDTFGNNRQNTDTFFNTALLDNEFMFGRNGYGYNNMMGNPYVNPNIQNQNVNLTNRNNNNNENNATENNTTTHSVDTTNNTQQLEENENQTDTETKAKKSKLTKNIDTYRNENTPSLRSKFKNFKQSVSKFFSKFSKPKNDTVNPVYRFKVDVKDDNSFMN